MSNLIKIKDISSKYDVSTRTLRYYEDMGLITSTRTDDYAYRLYDENAVKKLEQILILRKLNISIKDIQHIFNSFSSEVVLEILGKKIVDIDGEVALLYELKIIILEFIRQIEQADFTNDSDIKRLYEKAKFLESQITNVDYNSKSNSNRKEKQLSEKTQTANIKRLLEVTEQLDKKLPSVTVVKLPKFKAITSGWKTDHDFGELWDWAYKHGHLCREINFDNSEFYLDKEISCETNALIYALHDHVTETDTAPHKIIEFEGGLYATAVCIDMDDESMESIYPKIMKWIEGTNFKHDPKRNFMAHILYPLGEVKTGLGYNQLQRYVPIKINSNEWKTVYSLSKDEVVQGYDCGTTNKGFGTPAIHSAGSSEYTFKKENGYNTILISKRANDWDGIDIKLDSMNLPHGHHCLVKVSGCIADENISNKPGYIELTGLPGYDNMDSHSILGGKDFKLTHTFPVMKDKTIINARISSSHVARKTSLIINNIEVMVKPFADNYIPKHEDDRPMQIVTELKTSDFLCTDSTSDGKHIYSFEGKSYYCIGVIRNGKDYNTEEIVSIPAGKYMKTIMPLSYNDTEEFCKDIHEKYICEWKHGGAGFELSGEMELILKNTENEKDIILLLHIIIV
jgi:DNA-binding transcriptional MerR regulator